MTQHIYDREYLRRSISIERDQECGDWRALDLAHAEIVVHADTRDKALSDLDLAIAAAVLNGDRNRPDDRAQGKH